MVYPISSGKLINVGAFHAKPHLEGTTFPGLWVETIANDELLAAHEGWEPELQAILQVGLHCHSYRRLAHQLFLSASIDLLDGRFTWRNP